LIFLLEEAQHFFSAGIVLSNDAVGLVFHHGLVAVDRTALKGDIDAVGLELVDESLELTEEVVNDSVLAGGESATSTMSYVHKINY
jgi:alanine racemase